MTTLQSKINEYLVEEPSKLTARDKPTIAEMNIMYSLKNINTEVENAIARGEKTQIAVLVKVKKAIVDAHNLIVKKYALHNAKWIADKFPPIQ